MSSSVFAMKFRKKLGKLFYEQEVIKIVKSNTHGKRQEEIVIML